MCGEGALCKTACNHDLAQIGEGIPAPRRHLTDGADWDGLPSDFPNGTDARMQYLHNADIDGSGGAPDGNQAASNPADIDAAADAALAADFAAQAAASTSAAAQYSMRPATATATATVAASSTQHPKARPQAQRTALLPAHASDAEGAQLIGGRSPRLSQHRSR